MSSSARTLLPLALAMLAPLATRAAPAPLEPRPLAGEYYAESFFGMADFPDGTYAKVQLGLSNAGPGDGHGVCKVTVIDPAGKASTATELAKPGEWRFEGGDTTRFSVGPCSVSAAGTLRFVAPLAGATLTLTLAGAPREERVMALEARVPGGFYDLEVLLPWAKAELTLARDGEPPRTLSGHGYADHARSDALPGRIATRWVRFRAVRGDVPVMALARFPPDGGPVQGWVWRRGGERVALTRGQLKGPAESNGPGWSALLDGPGGPWKIAGTRPLERSAPLEGRGALGSLVRGLIGNPVTYTLRGALLTKATGEQVPGLIEVSLADE